MKQARSVISSINAGKNNALRKNNETVFWQREEWVRWALDEVLPVLNQAIADAEKENVLQSLHNENERLGLYKDAYGQPKQCKYPNCPYPCMDLPDCIEQEPVAWGFQNTAITGSNRWMMLREEVPSNDQYGGALWIPLYTHPPQRTEQEPVIDKSAAIRIATALGWEPKREWVGLTDEEIEAIWYAFHDREMGYAMRFTRAIESKLKQKNGYAEENT